MTTPSLKGRASWWRGVYLVARRESQATLDSNVAVATLIVALVASIAPFVHGFFLSGLVDATPFFLALPWTLALCLAALSMRLWSEDVRLRTLETWRALPLSPLQLVLGKWLSALLLHVVYLLLTTPVLLLLAAHGPVEWSRIAGGYAGSLLLGGWLLALGAWISSTTRDQTTAYVLSALLALALLALGDLRVWTVVDGWLPQVQAGSWLAAHLSPLSACQSFARGLVGLDAVVLLVGQTALYLWLNLRSLRAMTR
jgi:ABC-2 type transport system permease protein